MRSGSPLGIWSVFGNPRGAREWVEAKEGNEEARHRWKPSLATRPFSQDSDLVGQASGTKRLIKKYPSTGSETFTKARPTLTKPPMSSLAFASFRMASDTQNVKGRWYESRRLWR